MPGKKGNQTGGAGAERQGSSLLTASEEIASQIGANIAKLRASTQVSAAIPGIIGSISNPVEAKKVADKLIELADKITQG